MRIGLIDVDGHNFPNLSLMKISAYHKNKGDVVTWAGSLEHYDKVYMAKVFTFSRDDIQAYQADEIIKGGTGYDISSSLPPEIEKQFPDYGLYNINNIAYGFLTRGCPRHCNFCIVGDKEGLKSYKVADLKDFWNGQKNIELLDPNLLACDQWEELLQQIIDSGANVNVNQGMDIRLMTEEKQQMINQSKIHTIHFAWDNYPDWPTYEKLKQFRPGFRLDDRHLKVYVLTNFNTTHAQDIDRVYRLREIGYDPYIMIYDKPHAPRKTRLLQRWVNNKIIFRACESFEDYDVKRG